MSDASNSLPAYVAETNTSNVTSVTNLGYPVPPKPSSYLDRLEKVLERFSSDSSDVTIVADSEYIHGSLGQGRPEAEMWKEVVQIGAVKYKGQKQVETFNRLVRPSIHLDMPSSNWEEFKRITNLSKEEIVTNGIEFEEAWKEFMSFRGGSPIVIILGDREVYKWNFRLLGKNKDEEIDEMPWIILKPLLSEPLKPLCSGNLFEIVGFSEEQVCINGLTTHNALFDATSMGLFCCHYKTAS